MELCRLLKRSSYSKTEEELSLLGQQRSLFIGVFLDISSAGQTILYLKRANGGIVVVSGEYKARRSFFARIVGHDYIGQT